MRTTTRLISAMIAILGVLSLFTIATRDLDAAPRGGGAVRGGGFGGFRGGGFPMRTPPTGALPFGVHPGTMSHANIMMPMQMGNGAIRANSGFTMFNAQRAANTGFIGSQSFNGFGRPSTFSSGIGAFNLGLATSSLMNSGFSGAGGAGFSGFGSGINGFGINGFSTGIGGASRFGGLAVPGFDNLSGFNSFAPATNAKGLGFNGANGL